MVDAVSGEGLIGLEGLPSELKDRKVDIVSDVRAVPALLAKVGTPGLCRRMLGILRRYRTFGRYSTPSWRGECMKLNSMPLELDEHDMIDVVDEVQRQRLPLYQILVKPCNAGI